MTDDAAAGARDAAEAGPRGAREYVESPRSYREVLVVLAVLALGFGCDAALGSGGAVAHLPGWLVAAVLVAGADALIVASARATRTLVVTADELWVGEEFVPRDEIAGQAPAGDVPAELPVLGWPHGRAAAKGAVLRLADGRDVLVPTRRPDALLAALGVGATAPRSVPDVRVATEADLATLPELDARAGVVFRVAGYALPELPLSPDALADAAAVFVVGDPPDGFAWLDEVDGLAHLQEIAVAPRAMRTGLGSRLLEHACAWAGAAGHPALTLTTYADVPWNGPWYAARGFVEVDDPTPGLRAIRDHERDVGLDDVGRRIVMRRTLS
ncbi:N-acetylglutamate synthase, GNAT family [Jatrophihabitans endophyticus]|uniref:N-acetylglutamate synthase, GNAT family n=1 Tax=Jatrophihabitans endophyticus TaxID=1206085 RepID=A0A1M5QY27_9ACTN|nr:GNAT family N-acetyltransferase [Jatrophihabitans endophyticus]SHH19055.1 N-acetylglutamate synthase, GNAT family [Jatrophihabitans endophyticus]